MTDIETLMRTIIEPLINHPEDVSIDQIETDEFMEYHLHLHPDDIGRVIGRRGRVIRAIRTIVYSARVQGSKRTRIVIADDRDEVE